VSPFQAAMQLALAVFHDDLVGIDTTSFEWGRFEWGRLLALLRETYFSAHRGR
jgi:hypothetical protein